MHRPPLFTIALTLTLAACQPAPSPHQPPTATPVPPPTLPAIPNIPTHTPTPTHLDLGVAWYPEQWPESRWPADLALMQNAGITVVRVGEFAWSTLEPAEGQYNLEWLDRAVTLAAQHNIAVILCTPTDAPPAWLTDKYPDTLRVDETGTRLRHGGRRQFSYTSPRYRDFCKKITAQLAARFGKNPDVLGWQIGNELTDDSYDDYSKELFHRYLADKFKTLDNLNTHWATTYWSQTYFNWNEVPFPAKTDNPGLQLEYKHFVTDMWRSFVADQHVILRSTISPNQWITTNLGGLGWADRFDRFQLSQDLDLISWDAYVGAGHLDANRMAATHDLVRGWKQQNFWVMETQPGSVNWAGVNNMLDIKAKPAKSPGKPSATAPTPSPTGNGAAPPTARSSTTAASSAPTEPRSPSTKKSSKSAKNSKKPPPTSPTPSLTPKSPSSTTTTLAGPSTSSPTPTATTNSPSSSTGTAPSTRSPPPSTSSPPTPTSPTTN